MPFFDSRGLPENPASEYVVWVDVMGTQARMSRSLAQTANFVFKLHAAAISVANDLNIYPVMDGLYAASPCQKVMLDFLRSVFRSIADDFNQQDKQIYRFIIRGCLAFGPTIHGRDVQDSASRELAAHQDYRKAILLGLPMVQAHSNENRAPPFGIYVHESARSFAPDREQPLHELWWRWARDTDETWVALSKNLMQHYAWCAARSLTLDYRNERIETHKAMANQYFMPPDESANAPAREA